MGRIKLLFLFLLFLGLRFTSGGQTCQPNIDFELGNTSSWHYYVGYHGAVTGFPCCPIVTTTATTAILNRHTLTSGSLLDPYGFFPIVSPGGGGYSLRLGNDNSGAEAERARYYIHIPSGVSNYSLIYRYAVVLEDPPSLHLPGEKPRFEVNVYDSVTGNPIPCAQFSYVASASLPGFTLSSVPAVSTLFDIIYKSWTTASINLSGLGGATIAIDFTSADCSLGGHFGYGYLDMTCGLFAISSITCNDTIATLRAPEGFATYDWYDSLTFTMIGSGQSISFPNPAVPTTYAVIIQPYPGFGCNDTLFTRVIPSHLVVHTWGDTSVCLGKYTLIGAVATDLIIPLTYRWAPSSSLSCSNCATTYATIPGNTVYTVTVTNPLGCTKTDTVSVSELVTPPGILTHTDVSCFGLSDGMAVVTPPAGAFPCIYSWNTLPVQTDSVADHIVAGTYTVTVLDAAGCRGNGVVTISEPPPTILSIAGSTNPTTCLGTNGSINLNGLIPGIPYTVHYLFNGAPRAATLTASGLGVLGMAGLSAGIYSNIGIFGTLCPYNTVGPVVLTDPPNPALPGVGSNSPVCKGAALLLISACATPGVTYSWTGPGGFSSTLQNPGAIDPAQFSDSGLYMVAVMVNNCTSSDTTRVIIKPMPIPIATNNSPLCSGDTLIILSSSLIGGANYSWKGPDAFISNLQNPRISDIGIAASGSYTLTVTLDGCSDTVSTNVFILPTPPAPTAIDTAYCQFSPSVPLKGTGTGLIWYTQETGGAGSPGAPIPSTLIPGVNKWYLSQSLAGCISSRKEVKVTVYSLMGTSLVFSDTSVCNGSYISFKAVNNTNNNEDYSGITWYFGYGDSIKNLNPVIRSFDTTGIFKISAIVYHEVCPDTILTRLIKITPYPVLHIGSDTSICPGAPPIILSDYKNAANLRASWYWNTGQTSANISVTNPGIYYATVLINGCATSDTVVISSDCYLDVPNVFSPNSDDINDYFFPRQYLTKGLASFKLDIFNRWGQKVFTTTSIDGKGWDGKFNNTLQPEGVYVYIIDATFRNGKKDLRQGNVTLLR